MTLIGKRSVVVASVRRTEILCFGKRFECSFVYHKKKKRGEKGPRHEKYVLLIEEDVRKQCLKLLLSSFESRVIFVLAAIGRELIERNHN